MLRNILSPAVTIVLFISLFAASVFATEKTIILQSTTSTANSGLYDHILPIFTEKTGIRVHVVAVGTGQAIKNAMNGDGDVLLVHAKSAEQKFVADGFGVERFDLMYNDFMIVGPPADPAKIGGMKNASAALARISITKSVFASRGDNSGTHKKERYLWSVTGVDLSTESGTWYRETGSGMGATLNTAIGMNAYTLTDRGTWISFKNKSAHQILVEGGHDLLNQYGITLINPHRHPKTHAKAGQTFINWILSDQGQNAIANYKLVGQQLFFP
ncbi:MAG: solute-binding protein, partial [Gammaproteobacteria bacterium]|nr:solute-binding protein [Gammaproteobacteria bacterium]